MEKDKLNNYYKDLPQGFVEDYVIDAKKTSVAIIFSVVSVIMAIAAVVVCWLIKFNLIAQKQDYTVIADAEPLEFFIALIVLCVAMIVYLILHELTHGLVYKLMTKQKLTFGLTLTVAYCGLKEGYVNKKTAILAILAPFVIYSIIFIIAICLIPANIWCVAMILLFSVHFGGCVGDLYGAILLIFKYRGKQILMNDTGPKQSFYVLSRSE
jgi:hypothetical protein